MTRPSNADESVEVRISVLPVVRDWLDKLAALGLYGKNRTAVAERFVLDGVNRELRGEGLLRSPPPQASQSRKRSSKRR